MGWMVGETLQQIKKRGRLPPYFFPTASTFFSHVAIPAFRIFYSGLLPVVIKPTLKHTDLLGPSTYMYLVRYPPCFPVRKQTHALFGQQLYKHIYY